MPRAVLFDVDGVLIHSMFHPDPDRCRRWDRYMLEDLGVSREIMQDFFRENFHAVIRGKTSLLSELAYYLPTIGYTGSPMDFLAYWFKNDTHLNLPLLQAIKQLGKQPGVSLFLATNQEHLRAFHLWTNLGLSHIFQDMFYAARLGQAKPDMAYFVAVDQLLGKQEQPPLFFDDGEKNVAAANAHGWEGVLFDRLEDFTGHPWVTDQISKA